MPRRPRRLRRWKWERPTDAQIATALSEAVTVLYLADNSDFRSALWAVVDALSPDVRKLLERDERVAHRLCSMREDRLKRAGSDPARRPATKE